MDLTPLWDLQNLYLKKQAMEKLLSADVDVKALRQEKKQILASQDALSKLKEELKQKRGLLKQLETLLADLTFKRQVAEKNLYGGEISNHKELKSIQQQLKQLDEELNNCENEFLNLSTKIDEDANFIEKEKQALKERKREYNLKVENYLAGKKKLEEERKKIKQDIKELEESIDPELLAIYNRKKQTTGLIVLSNIQNKICSVCHMIIPPLILKEAKRKAQLVYCENCDRILYYK